MLSNAALAHEQTAPVPNEQPRAVWPHGQTSAHDVIVPVIVVVDPEGRVTSALVESSLSADFDAAALDVARAWTFKPALDGDRPVAAKIRAVVRFVGESTPAAPLPIATAPAETQTVSVYGTKAPPPPRSASEVVQDRNVLAAAPHRSGSELLLTVPGLALSRHNGEGGAAQIFFRGFDAVHGQDLEIWAGGAPVNDVSNIHGQGYADLNFVMPEVVSRIRSAPGSYDPRQGDFSVAGSIWMDLGYAEPGVTAKATLGMFDTRRYFLAYHPASMPETTFAAAEYYSTDGFGPSRSTRRASAMAQHEVAVGDVKVRVMASTYAATFDSAGVLRLSDIDNRKIDRYGSYDESQGGDASRTQVVVDIHRQDEESRWSLAPYFILRSMRLRENFIGYLVTPVSGSAADVAANRAAQEQGNSEQQINDVGTVGMTGSYHRHLRLLSSNDTFEAGISARYDRIEQSQRKLSVATGETTLQEVGAKVQATDVAGWLDLGLHPVRRVTLRGGVRVDGLAYTTEDDGGSGDGERRSAQGAHVGAKGTADVLVIDHLHAVASYGDGFRSPQARSLQQGERAPFTTVRSYEGGLRYQTSDVRMTASLFHTSLSDDLAFNQATARNERTPPTSRNGFAFEMAAQPIAKIIAAASVTYTRSTFTNTDGGYRAGDLLPDAPQLVVRADTAWTPVLGQLWNRTLTGKIGFGMTAIAKRPLPYAEYGHNYALLDGQASVRLKEVELGVSAYNLLGLDWYEGEYTYASNFTRGALPDLVPQRHVTVGAPRTVLGTLSLHL